MKKIHIILVSLLLVFGFGCEDKYVQIYKANSPVYLSYETLRASVQQTGTRELVHPGKMYFKEGYLFIVEEREGIHVIDNSDPSNPTKLSFIEVPGVVDIAIKEQIMYADSYIDLVALDISDLDQITEVERLTRMFPYTLPEHNTELPIARIDETKGVVIAWEEKTVEEETENRYYPVYFESSFMDFGLNSSQAGASGTSTFGIGGSMARFGLYDDYLYAVDESQLHIIDVSTPEDPTSINDFFAGWMIETMFLMDDKMFLGTSNGVLIYDLSSPFAPSYMSEFRHVTACDPVVVQDTLAFVTLRGGNNCGSNVNELDVLSVSDLEDAKLLKRYPMTGPYGLGVDDNTLFVCDGEAGLKIYDIEDPLTITDHQIAHYDGIVAYDVIPLGDVLLLVGESGFYQYDYSDLNDIQLLSSIEVNLSN